MEKGLEEYEVRVPSMPVEEGPRVVVCGRKVRRQTLVNFEGRVSEPTSAETLIFGFKMPMVRAKSGHLRSYQIFLY